MLALAVSGSHVPMVQNILLSFPMYRSGQRRMQVLPLSGRAEESFGVACTSRAFNLIVTVGCNCRLFACSRHSVHVPVAIFPAVGVVFRSVRVVLYRTWCIALVRYQKSAF